MIINNKLIEIVIKFTGKLNFEITPETTIEGDLRLAEDDIVDFINEVIFEFNLNSENFESYKYFAPEGFDLFGIFKIINKIFKRTAPNKSSISITIGHLQNWITVGYWSESIK